MISTNIKNPCADEGLDSWKGYSEGEAKCGIVRVEFNDAKGVPVTNNVFFVRQKTAADNSVDNAHLYQNIVDLDFVGNDLRGKWIILAGLGWAEYVEENYITDHPYLYAYAMNKDSQKIYQYIQGKDGRGNNLVHSEGSKRWQIMSGIFQIKQDLKEEINCLRVFLKQASHAKVPPKNKICLFDDLLFIALQDDDNFESAANSIMDEYTQECSRFVGCDAPITFIDSTWQYA